MTNYKTTIVIPTIGNENLLECVSSASNQPDTMVYLVIDGVEYEHRVKKQLDKHIFNRSGLKICVLPVNVGANGFYGHRVISAFSHLVNTPYVCFLDEDNFLESNHVETCLKSFIKPETQFVYTLRNVIDNKGIFVCKDECESLGKLSPIYGNPNSGYMVDTSAYFYRTDFIKKYSHFWHKGYGADRLFYDVILHLNVDHECTNEYTLNYRLGGNEHSVKAEFFLNGNNIIKQRIENESYSIFI